MPSERNKNRIKTILKLIVVVPIFFYIGTFVASDWLDGNHTSFLLYLIVCILIGPVISKI